MFVVFNPVPFTISRHTTDGQLSEASGYFGIGLFALMIALLIWMFVMTWRAG